MTCRVTIVALLQGAVLKMEIEYSYLGVISLFIHFSISQSPLSCVQLYLFLSSLNEMRYRNRVNTLVAMIVIPSYVVSLSSSGGVRPSRRNFVFEMAISSGLITPGIASAETVGKDEDCNDSTCLGVWDGILANCAPMTPGAGCVSSQDDTTQDVFLEPWDYAEAVDLDWKVQKKRLLPAILIVSKIHGDEVQVLFQQERYVKVMFVDMKTLEKSIGEFYFTPNDSTVQYRVSSISPNTSVLSLKNKERCELIRKELGYLKLPVIRTRTANDFSPGEWALAKVMGII